MTSPTDPEHMPQLDGLRAVNTGFTLTIAVLSWHLYELPLNRLKRHFSYPRAIAPAAGGAQIPRVARA